MKLTFHPRALATAKLGLVTMLGLVLPAPLAAQETPVIGYPAALERTPTLASPSASAVRQRLFAWLAAQGLAMEKQVAAEAAWPAVEVESDGQNLSGSAMLDRFGRVAAAADERIAAMVSLCSQPRQVRLLPDTLWLQTIKPDNVRHNLRLYYGRWLAREKYYEEALEQLADLEPEQVVDPATLLFSQAVAHHRLLHKRAGLEVVNRLLDDVADAPARYRSVAMLLHADLSQLEDESLDRISRQMEDVNRRLELGRTGKKVIQVEGDIIAALDRLIREAEGHGPPAPPSPPGPGPTPPVDEHCRPRVPAPDSNAPRARAAGDAERRPVGARNGWGDLPPAEQQRVLQDIGKDFPAHYRDVVETYFRKIAAEGEKPK